MNGAISTVLAWAAQAAPAVANTAAGAAPTAAGGAVAAPPAPLFPPELILPVALVAILFYFLVLRPQRADTQTREKMIEEMNKGDQVVTAGGIHGTIEGIDKGTNTVTVMVAPKITLRFSRTSISTVVSKKSKPKGDKEEKSEEATA